MYICTCRHSNTSDLFTATWKTQEALQESRVKHVKHLKLEGAKKYPENGSEVF